MNVGTRMQASGAFDHLLTLGDVVKDFVARYGGNEQSHDEVLPFVLSAPTLKAAIIRSVDGKTEDGKMFHFGTCVRTSSKDQLKGELIFRQRYLVKAADFDRLYDCVDRASGWGIGRFTKYVVASRVGAWRHLEPRDFLYLHAGPMRGWRALTGERGSFYRVPWAHVPVALRELSPRKVEDLLCEYSTHLHRGMLR